MARTRQAQEQVAGRQKPPGQAGNSCPCAPAGKGNKKKGG